MSVSKLHKNAALTISQRKLVRRLYLEGASISSLARRFGVNRKTAERWAKRDSVQDRPSGPQKPRRVVTPEYREAVLAHRRANPDHGAITIAFVLKEKFAFANRGTIQQILTQAKLSARQQKQSKPPKN